VGHLNKSVKLGLVYLIGISLEVFQDLFDSLHEKRMIFRYNKDVEIVHDEVRELFFNPVTEQIRINRFVKAQGIIFTVKSGKDHSFDIQKVVTEIHIVIFFGEKSPLPAQAEGRFIIVEKEEKLAVVQIVTEKVLLVKFIFFYGLKDFKGFFIIVGIIVKEAQCFTSPVKELPVRKNGKCLLEEFHGLTDL